MIVLLESVHPDALALLETVDEVRQMTIPTKLDENIDLGKVQVVLTRGRGRIDSQMIAQLPNLKVVGRCGAGLDNIDLAAAKNSNISVVYAPGRTTTAVSEHALMLMLGLARKVALLDNAVKKNKWSVRENYEGIELHGKQLGIFGLGSIGNRLAAIGAALSMNVCYWSRSARDPKLEYREFNELLATSDVIQICLALTPQTKGLVSSAQFALMKPGVLLINTARGQVVDHQALLAAISAKIVGGYATDVWDVEPPLDDDPLIGNPKVLVTPHVAGLTDVSYREICLAPATAVVAILSGNQVELTCVFEQKGDV